MKKIIASSLVFVAVLSAAGQIHPQDAKSSYPTMAPIEQYRMDRDAEIVLARSAAPASISKDASVMVMGQKNYETVVQGTNGFVCLVGRSWGAPFDNPEFWNPKNRSPECFNPPAALSVLPYFLKTTGMVLAGFSQTQMFDAIKAAVDKKELGAPASGSLIYMMSKEGYLTDQPPHNLNHLMYDVPRMDGAAWGANLPGAPIYFQQLNPAPITEFFVVMGNWSDGTPVNGNGNSASESHKHWRRVSSDSEEPGEEIYSMAKLVYGLNQSLDGYVDHMKLGPPVPAAFRHFIESVRGLTGILYGRRMYEIMRYWDEDLPDWDADDQDFAAAWRSQPKWVVSRSLKSVGPNATLVADDFEAVIRRLKAELAGEIGVGGPDLAQSLTEAGLIDEYQLYLRPVVLGRGKPFFAGPQPPLRLVASDLIAENFIRLTYVPA